MALTKVSGSILKDPLNLGEVSIGGTLTYQDVTNIDSVGVITARTGIDIVAGDLVIPDSIIHSGDTDTKIRFHANDTVSVETGGSQQLTIGANINIISGELTIPDTIRHRNDANTKIRFPADDTITAETAGTERFRIDSSGRVLIGLTTSQTTDSNAHSKLQIATSAGPNIALGNNSTDINDDGRLGIINFNSNHDGTYHEVATIASRADADHASNSKPSRLEFYTTQTGNTQGIERLRITSGGSVGIGTDDPDSNFKLDVAGSINVQGNVAAGNAGRVYFGNSDVASIDGAQGGSGYLKFLVAGSERVRITPAGSVRIGGSTNSSFSAHTAADDLVIGATSGSNGMTILTGSATGSIFFNDGSGNDGVIQYVHSSTPNYMRLASSGQIEFDAGGSERMRISSEGYVTKPYNPMFKATMTASRTISSNGWHKIQFDTDTASDCFDVGSNFDTSTHRFTAPVTGYYQFGLNQRIDGGNNQYYRVAFYKNGSAGDGYVHGMAIYRDTDTFPYYSFSITSLIQLDASEYVEAYAYSYNDTSWSTQRESQFYGYLVG